MAEERLRKQIARLEVLHRDTQARYRALEATHAETRAKLQLWEGRREELERLNRRLAEVNVDSAELMAELEDRNDSLKATNAELARANAHGAELMAAIELKEEEILALNRSLSRANVRAAQLLVERESQLAELEQLNHKLQAEVRRRKRAQREQKQLAERLQAANADLDRLATLDSLTQTLNRRGLERELLAHLNRAHRSGDAVGVLLADLDNFKAFNEGYGHAVGDIVLTEVSRRLANSLRVSDSLARIGGDEFLAVLPAVDRDTALAIAERVRAAIATTSIPAGEVALSATVSLGVGLLPESITHIDGILRFLKDAQAASKQQGKNRLTYVESPTLESASPPPEARTRSQKATPPGPPPTRRSL